MGTPSSLPPSDKKIARVTNLMKLGIMATVLIGSAWTGSRVLFNAVTDVASNANVAAAVKEHDESVSAHKPVRDDYDARLKAVGLREMELKHELRETQKIAAELGKHLVGLLAAEREKEDRLKPAAAGYYRGLYASFLLRGFTAQEALEAALKEPWPRPAR